jgi:hypothetical protein
MDDDFATLADGAQVRRGDLVAAYGGPDRPEIVAPVNAIRHLYSPEGNLTLVDAGGLLWWPHLLSREPGCQQRRRVAELAGMIERLDRARAPLVREYEALVAQAVARGGY